MSNQSSPPPRLPKGENADTGSFDRWLYNFWVLVTGTIPDGQSILIADRIFNRNTAQARETMLGADAQRILEGQIFGG